MTPYFADKQDLLATELQSWLGTPWRHHCHVRRLGADCIGMVYGVLVGTGAIAPFDIPDYPRDWHMHRDDELLVLGLRALPEMLEFNDGRMMDGDIIIYRYGKASAHAGIYFDRGIYHLPSGQRAVRSPMSDGHLARRMKYAFRCMTMDGPQ